ncbi:MAG: hypothetical protein J5582_12870 [Ruminococcus sp.]|uniref:pullulanase X25 domain-containing protein n=1 Tax=Ruminococcus sp. TaxID=41978 RepID=UPI0025E1642A|nr:hypothetical protein [Ruminococcus sp.]MBO4867430.1 hypothetical protein [Ruminococcus sp.]
MKFRKLVSVLCAAAVVMTSAGGLPLGSFKLFDTVITASSGPPDTTGGNGSNINSDPIIIHAHDLYIAGNGSTERGSWVNGENWNAGADSNKMSYDNDSGIYSISYENVPAGEGYEFKFTQDGSWEVSYGYSSTTDIALNEWHDIGTSAGNDSNIKFELTKNSDLTIEWNINTSQFRVSATSVHKHSWSYTANGNTITAECTDGCDITNGLTMTISAPTVLEYDGNPKEVTLNSDYNITAFPDTYTIEYYSGTTKLSSAPTNKGSYTAKVTAGNATASVEFTITKTVPYISYTYNDNGITETSELECKTYTSIASNTTTWNNGWYVVDSNVTISSRITVNGNNVHLILCDGYTLNAPKGIRVATGKGLTIYAQSEAADTMGILNSRTSDDGSSTAAIGGNNGEAAGTIIINGGKLTFSGSTNGSAGGGAGIGTGRYASDANVKKMKIVINGGIIKNNSLKSVCAIGGGQGCGGGTILINGGNLDLNTYSGAAIGRAYSGSNGYTNITINGGTVAARAWTAAPGIGGESATVKITGGNIIAYSGGTNNGILGKSVTFGNNMVVRSGTENDLSKALPCLDYIQSTTNKKFAALWTHEHSFSYECADNHFAVKCANENCNLINGELGLTLYADDKIYDGTAYDLQHSDCDSFAHTFADEFKLLTGNTVSIGEIELYEDGSKISAAINAGSYTAKQNITVGSTTYTVVKDFNIISTDPAYTVTIPATVDLGGAPATVSIDSMENIPTGKSVRVTIAGDTDGNFTVEQADDKLSYTITGTRPSHLNAEPDDTTQLDVKDTDEILHVDGPEDTGNPRYIELKFNKPDQEPKYAGDYTGTVTFNVSIS